MNDMIMRLSAEVRKPNALRLFTVLVYSWFLINAVLVLPYIQMMWDRQNVFFRQGHSDTLIENFIYHLIYAPSVFRYVFAIHIISALLSMLEFRLVFVPRLATWITALMLYYSAAEAFNSGMMLMMMLAFYGSVILTNSDNPYRKALTNLAALACVIQIGLVYFAAAMYKLGGTQWPSGTALYYALHIDRFSSDLWLGSSAVRSAMLMKILTWTALAYQLLFPVMLFVKRGRNVFLMVGVVFHLFIGVVMHLWDFALTMIFSYSILIQDDLAGKILRLIVPGRRTSK
jgi:hypothetical protein